MTMALEICNKRRWNQCELHKYIELEIDCLKDCYFNMQIFVFKSLAESCVLLYKIGVSIFHVFEFSLPMLLSLRTLPRFLVINSVVQTISSGMLVEDVEVLRTMYFIPSIFVLRPYKNCGSHSLLEFMLKWDHLSRIEEEILFPEHGYLK